MGALDVALGTKNVLMAADGLIHVKLESLGGGWILQVEVEVVLEVMSRSIPAQLLPPESVGVWSASSDRKLGGASGHGWRADVSGLRIACAGTTTVLAGADRTTSPLGLLNG